MNTLLNRDFDIAMMKMAYTYASQNSTDTSTQNAAIIVPRSELNKSDDNLLLIREANHFPRGVQNLPERWERPHKYNFVEHAERNAIYAAARLGVATDGAIMYVPWFACSDCARAIIQAGIVEVIGHNTPIHEEANPHWKDSIKNAMDMLDEAGVKRRYIDDVIGVEILFNNEKVTP